MITAWRFGGHKLLRVQIRKFHGFLESGRVRERVFGGVEYREYPGVLGCFGTFYPE